MECTPTEQKTVNEVVQGQPVRLAIDMTGNGGQPLHPGLVNKWFSHVHDKWILKTESDGECGTSWVVALLLVGSIIAVAVTTSLYALAGLILPVGLIVNSFYVWGKYQLEFDDATQTVYYRTRGIDRLAKEFTLKYSDCIRIACTLEISANRRATAYYVYLLSTTSGDYKFLVTKDNLDEPYLNAFLRERVLLTGIDINNPIVSTVVQTTYTCGNPPAAQSNFPDV